MTEPPLDIRDAPEHRRIEARLNGSLAGFLAYRNGADRVALVHTEVDPEFEGRGIGGALARFALDEARREGRTVIVECPFVTSWLRRHREYADVVAPRARIR
jgi:uncharacterized protein